jgi:hypothetical protein
MRHRRTIGEYKANGKKQAHQTWQREIWAARQFQVLRLFA